jgi:hypothetical protein
MDAKKCDRCGKFYEPYQPGAAHKNSNILIFAEEYVTSDNVSGYCEQRQYELCSDCMLAAVHFMQALMGGE